MIIFDSVNQWGTPRSFYDDFLDLFRPRDTAVEEIEGGAPQQSLEEGFLEGHPLLRSQENVRVEERRILFRANPGLHARALS